MLEFCQKQLALYAVLFFWCKNFSVRDVVLGLTTAYKYLDREKKQSVGSVFFSIKEKQPKIKPIWELKTCKLI